jgi:hypothetical protein
VVAAALAMCGRAIVPAAASPAETRNNDRLVSISIGFSLFNDPRFSGLCDWLAAANYALAERTISTAAAHALPDDKGRAMAGEQSHHHLHTHAREARCLQRGMSTSHYRSA